MTTVSSELMLRGEREDVTYNCTACYESVNSVTSLQTHSTNVTEQERDQNRRRLHM